MPQYIYSDGDESGGELPKKRYDLEKYASRPDINIRDTFWAIMAAYATRKNMKNDIRIFSSSKVALMKIALSILKNPESAYYGLSLTFTVLYTLMMMLDGEWVEEFKEFLNIAYREKTGLNTIVRALKKLSANHEYVEQLIRYFRSMILSPEYVESALFYINEMKTRAIVEGMKKEIMIIARNDVDITQRNAMSCLSLIKDEQDVLTLLAQLLAHWDAETRKHAAILLKDAVSDDVLKIAKAQFDVENNLEVKKLLSRIIKRNLKEKEQKDE
jgi:hypothetical protein